MARAILPTPEQAARQLPYLYVGKLTHQNGTDLVLNVPCSVWPVDGRNSDRGRTFDHQGECPLTYRGAILGEGNVRMVVNGKTYAIVEATPQDFLPHIALRLRETRASI